MKSATKYLSLILVLVFLIVAPIKAEVKVYDANDQYIGILLDQSYGRIAIFIPSLSVVFFIGDSWVVGEPFSDNCVFVFYESSDCSGTPYTYVGIPTVLESNHLGGFFLSDYSTKRQLAPGSNYTYNFDTNEYNCIQSSGSFTAAPYYEVKPVQLPFNTPVAMPLRYETSMPGDLTNNSVVGLEDAIRALQVISGMKPE